MPDSTQTLASSESISSYAKTGIASEVTFRANEAQAQHYERWQAIVNRLLDWMREIRSPGVETSSIESIESAIDLAVDSRDEIPAPTVPTSVGLTDDHGVAFEWHLGDEVVTIEIVASGIAEMTRFRVGRVVEEGLLVRNPQTRRLELRGPADS